MISRHSRGIVTLQPSTFSGGRPNASGSPCGASPITSAARPVLGANDGVVSTASLLVGVAAAGASRHQLLLTGLAGLVAGAMSMAAGEYVSVSSQADAQAADLALEHKELTRNPEMEQRELAGIYRQRGLSADLVNAPMDRAALRVAFWGALAMALTAGVGRLFGVSGA